MHKVDYCQARLMRSFGLFAGGGLIAAFLLPGGALKWLVTPVLLAAAALSGLKLFGDRSAVLWDERGVTLITLTGRRSVTWRELLGINVERMTHYLWGFIPVSSVDFLVIKTRGGLLASNKLRISASLLELPPGGSAELAVTLKRAHATAIGGVAAVPVAAAQLPPQAAAETDNGSENGFDPDAVIARYLAQKAAAPAAAAETPGMPAAPVRPVFGRKAV